MIFRVAPNRKYCFPAETCDKNKGEWVRQDEHGVGRQMTMGVPPYLAGRIPPLRAVERQEMARKSEKA